MNVEQSTPPRASWTIRVFAVVTGCGLLLGLTAAQEPTKAGPQGTSKSVAKGGVSDPDRGYQVYRLRNLGAADMARVLQAIFPDFQIVPEPISNTLLVAAPAVDMAKVVDIIQKLDVPGPDAKANESKVPLIIPLKHQLADELVNTLTKIYKPNPTESAVNLSCDLRTNTIVVVAPAAETAKIKDLIAQLDVPASAKTQPDAKAPQTQMIQVKHAAAAELANTLNALFGAHQRESAIRFTFDQPSNTIIVQAPAEELAKVKDVLSKLDVLPPAQEIISRLKIYPMRFIEPDKVFEETLGLVFQSGRGSFVIDRLRKQVIVSADPATMAAADTLIANLDRKSDERPAQDAQVRLVWLVNGTVREDVPAVPDDLKEVLPGLAKMGIDKPRLAAQTLVSVTPNTEFQAKGVTKLGDTTRFALTGRYYDKNEVPGLQLTILATGASGEEICNLQTEISAPPGHLVVLGMTPTGTMTSVFVVQVLRQDAKKPGPQK